MTDHPIIFSAPMVRALIEGRKTQTRRVIKAAPPEATSAGTTYSSLTGHSNVWTWLSGDPRDCETWDVLDDFRLPYAVGDRLYVKEAWWAEADYDDLPPRDIPRTARLSYGTASEPVASNRYRHARFMPRWASRLTLTVTDVRVQRVQDITEADAIAEGVERIDDPRGTAWRSYETIATGPRKGQPHPHADVPNASPVTSFREIWNSLHGPGAWDANPWVVALTFDVRRGNIDGGHDG